MRTVCSANFFGGSTYPFRDICGSAIAAWSGAVMDTKRHFPCSASLNGSSGGRPSSASGGYWPVVLNSGFVEMPQWGIEPRK